MKSHCALCGRLTLNPAVMIGEYPVGPTCARRAGLVRLSERKAGVVFAVVGRKAVAKHDARTLDLFEVPA